MKLSIRLKFLAILTGVVVATVAAFLALATGLFEADKEAYVYDASASLAEAMASETDLLLAQAAATIRRAARQVAVASEAGNDAGGTWTTLTEAIASDENDVVYMALFDASAEGTAAAPLHAWHRADFLEQQGLGNEDVDRARASWPVPLSALGDGKPHVANLTLPGGVPLLAIGVQVPSAKDVTGLALLRQDRLLRVFTQSHLHTAFLVDAYGAVVAHPDLVKGLATGGDGVAWMDRIAGQSLRTGALEVTAKDGRRWLTAYSRLATGGLTVVAQAPRDQAFAASRQLVAKSAYFAVALVSAAFLISLIFARSLTRPIRRLFEATAKISAGDFNIQVPRTSGDEIGTLTTSFNSMAGRIVALMGEVRDKARMEKELETARLVQENLFPEARLSNAQFDLAGFYAPASECGGDWWGHFTVGNRLFVMIGDATGHGVPAALITAAAQSCCTTIHQVRLRAPSLALTPKTIMGDLNAAVHCAARGKMNMTFFVAMIDLSTGRMTYTNASHELPVVLGKGKDGEQTLTMMTGDPDPCLGEARDTVYQEHVHDLAPGDTLVYYTDGLVELRNAEETEWGERRFLKTLKAHAAAGSEVLRDKLIDAARTHQGAQPPDDDITYIVVQMKALTAHALAS